MADQDIYKKLLEEFTAKLHFLADKPEESAESTLKALWFKAAGISISSEKAVTLPLPDLTDEQLVSLSELAEKRFSNIPLAHITGRQNFMGIELLSDSRALIPRKETEILGRRVLEIGRELIQDSDKLKVMDVCCGSGNLGIAMATYFENSTVFSSDITPDAVQLASENIKFLSLENRVTAFQGDMMEAFNKPEHHNSFDLIICNPPYISSAKVVKMDSEISGNEPVEAFDGGMLGIKIIQRLISESPAYLKKSGWLAFEVGLGQGDFIRQLVERSGNFDSITTSADSQNNVRVISARRQ